MTQLKINDSDSGWYSSQGLHKSSNPNYCVGDPLDYDNQQYRNFFTFDIPKLTGKVVSASIRIYSSRVFSPEKSENYQLYDIKTSVSKLQEGGKGLTNIYEDLGSGNVYGNRVIKNGENDQYLSINLNSNFIEDVNKSGGKEIAVGGAITTLNDIDDQEILFASSGDPFTKDRVVLFLNLDGDDSNPGNGGGDNGGDDNGGGNNGGGNNGGGNNGGGNNGGGNNGGNSVTLTSSKNMVLSKNSKNLILTGKKNISGTGNSKDNLILGNKGNNFLKGKNGDDTIKGSRGNDQLVGGDGNDLLVGGLGKDAFRFDSPLEGKDTITKFIRKDDVIFVDKGGFRGGLKLGAISDDQLVLGSTALDKEDRFLYKRSIGALWYDKDGAGGAGKIQIATIANKAVLDNIDIVVV